MLTSLLRPRSLARQQARSDGYLLHSYRRRREPTPATLQRPSTEVGQTDRSTKAYNEFWKLIEPDSHRYREMLEKDNKYTWQYPTDIA